MTGWGPLPIDGGTRFRLWAPSVDAVGIEIDRGPSVPMTSQGNGWFAVDAAVGAGARYRFRIAPDLAVPDPAARQQADDVHGWSVVVDQNAYRWQVAEWNGRPWGETVLYEVHAGVLGGCDGVAAMLPGLAELGVTAIELMPINAFGGTRNWGYDGVLPYAPANAYGSPDALKALVDRAHGLGLMVFLDVVYNHFGPDGNYLGAYAAEFFHPEVNTPWGGAVAVDRPAVSRFFVDNALMWLNDYRFDGLRFDAVHAIADNDFLDAMATEIRAAIEPGRHVHLVLENESNDPDRLSTARYDAQWNDDFHNVLHVLLTGETSAYYGDFAERPAERLARCLAEGFIYQGDISPNHQLPRGSPSGHLPPTAFVSFLQNHDQVGNRAMGERLTLLTDPAKLRAATALLLLCPQIPLLFMGDETGSHAPFLFFTDFHDELADAVREGRRREFAKFAAFADEAARAAIPDPNDAATFAHSRPVPSPDAAGWRELYQRLLALRHQRIVPHLDGAKSAGATATGPAAVEARWRLGDGTTLVIALNLGDAAVAVDMPAGELLYTQGEFGAPASVAAWIA